MWTVHLLDGFSFQDMDFKSFEDYRIQLGEFGRAEVTCQKNRNAKKKK